MDEFKKITSIDEVKEISAKNDGASGEYFVQLGSARSWKQIYYNQYNGKFYVVNEIDESDEILTESEIISPNHVIGEAIRSGCFYFAWC